jgi:putative spermidine/putrescine transport system permease protein
VTRRAPRDARRPFSPPSSSRPPALVGIAYSAAASVGLAGAGARGFTAARVAAVLGDAETWAGLAWTLWVAGASTALATAAAVGVAVAFRGSRPADRLARSLAALPLPVPHVVAAAAAVLALGQSGLLARVAVALGAARGPQDVPALVYDPAGVGLVLTLAWKEFAFLAVVSTTLLAGRGVAAEEAARTLGAGRWATFARVTWPALWRGLLPSLAAVFIFAAGNYEAAALLAPSDPTALPLLTVERAEDPDLSRRADAHVVTLLTLALGAAAVAAHEWARARAEGGR